MEGFEWRNFLIFKMEQLDTLVNKKLDRIFFSLADKNRRYILSLLIPEDLMVTEISNKTSLSLASTSKHVQVLVESGLILQKKIGRQRFCSTQLDALAEAGVWLSSIGLLDLLDLRNLEEFLVSEKLG